MLKFFLDKNVDDIINARNGILFIFFTKIFQLNYFNCLLAKKINKRRRRRRRRRCYDSDWALRKSQIHSQKEWTIAGTPSNNIDKLSVAVCASLVCVSFEWRLPECSKSCSSYCSALFFDVVQSG